LQEIPSHCHVVHSDIEVKFWMEAVPSTERVRPSRCPRCTAAARPVGGRLGVVGHGLRERQVRGPLRPGEPPRLLVVLVRRFRCLACGAVITVVPAGVATRRHFGAGAIGIALARFGRGERACGVRDGVGGVGPPEGGWVTLRRWAAAVRQGALLSRLRAISGSSARDCAMRAATVLFTYAAPSLSRAPFEEQVFAGAVQLARAA
jgi:hypothetical protein